jgi:hypothetical protein
MMINELLQLHYIPLNERNVLKFISKIKQGTLKRLFSPAAETQTLSLWKSYYC